MLVIALLVLPTSLGYRPEEQLDVKASGALIQLVQKDGGADIAPLKGVDKFKFDPDPAPDFSPLYLPGPGPNTAAVNAGDYKLYVGRGAINGAFEKLLKKEQGEGGSCDQYAVLHDALLSASISQGRSLVAAPAAEPSLQELRLAASFGQAGQDGTKVGSVFIDVFDASARPLNEKNVAMLYVVGPKGEECTFPVQEGSGPHLAKEAFLDSVQLLGRRAVEAVAEYNSRWAGSTVSSQELPKIEEIRWCLVSGGVYRHGQASKFDVAKATLQGMSFAPDANLTVTFTYDENVFEQAHKSKL